MIRGKRFATVLKKTEEKYPMVGTSLVPIFFTRGPRVKGNDLGFWQSALESRLAPKLYGTRIDGLGESLIEPEGKKPREKSAAVDENIETE